MNSKAGDAAFVDVDGKSDFARGDLIRRVGRTGTLNGVYCFLRFLQGESVTGSRPFERGEIKVNATG
jgi:hypothetical protein